MLNEGQLNSGTDYDWLTQCHFFFLITNFDWEQHMCNVYGSIVQRVGEKVSFGHLIENTSRDKPCQKCQGMVIFGLLSWTVITSRIISIQKLQVCRMVQWWCFSVILCILLIDQVKKSSLQTYHPCKRKLVIFDCWYLYFDKYGNFWHREYKIRKDVGNS